MNMPGWLGRLHAPMGFRVKAVDANVMKQWGPDARVMNLGSKNSSFPGAFNVDVVPHGPAVDVVTDGARLPFRDASLDGVIAKFVLEHVPDPQAVLSEIFRVLKPGGTVFATVPFVEPFHADPGDYQRYTAMGLQQLFSKGEKVEGGAYYGPASALVEVLREFCACFFDTVFLKKLVRFFAGWIFWPVKYLDLFLGRKKSAVDCAYGLYIIVRKREVLTD